MWLKSRLCVFVSIHGHRHAHLFLSVVFFLVSLYFVLKSFYVPSVVDMAADMDIEEKQVEELGMLMTALGQSETVVAAIFGPGWFTVRARRFHMRPGTVMDLRAGHDFNKETDRLRAREWQTNEMPLLLVGSPRCAAFSQLQN